MASESRDPGSLTVSLPPDLEEWLDQQAADLDLDRERVLVQLLASYRATADTDGDLLAPEDVEPAVKRVLGERLPDVADAVADRVAADLREELAADLREQVAEDLREDLDGPDEQRLAAVEAAFEELESEYRETLEDVRKRVIQVKRETDAKAPADHDHAEIDRLADRVEALEAQRDRLEDLETALDRLDAVEDELDRLDGVDRNAEHLEDVQTELDGVESELAALRGKVSQVDAGRVETIESDLADAREKLQTVAYVVRDLRDAVEDGGASEEAVDRIKRRAAEEDLARAACGNCGDGVRIGLLTEPSCPHCDATLDGLEPSGRPFGLGSAKLTVAAGLEAGDDATKIDEIDEIPTANRGDRR